MAEDIISRSEAKTRGLVRYCTGEPCKHGHIAERQTTNGVCITCSDAINKRWCAKNQDKVKEKWRKQSLRYSRESPERVRRNKKNWELSNPDKLKEKSDRRAARERNASGRYTVAEIMALLEKQDWKCNGCGVSLQDRRHKDHIVPLARGGSSDIGNLQWLCPGCNRSKGVKTHAEWLVWKKEQEPHHGLRSTEPHP